MENNNKKFHYIIISLLVLVFVATLTISSYAYFTATVTGTSNNNVITTGSMEIEFSDGPQVGLENALPGSFVEKTFSVRNTGTVDTYYDIYMSDLINNFADKTDLVYTLTSSNGASVSETQVPDENTKIVQNKSLSVGQTHNYTLRITFKETNDNQDDNKGKTFSTVIRVNEVKDKAPTIVEKVTSLVDGADTTSTDVIENTDLAYDGTEDNNLRYVGVNPNNYVKFNNELWRIIGVMNNIENESGQVQSLVKIIRNDKLGNYVWDSSNENDGHGINQWGESSYIDGTLYEGADLMRELNYDYLGDVQVGTDGKWYSGRFNAKSNTMPTSLIDSESKNMMDNVVWHLGSPNNNNGTYVDYSSASLIAPYVYTHERSDTNGKLCHGGITCNDTVVRTSTWTGKIALIYPSDYLYATSGGNTTERNDCLNTSQYSWNSSNISDCKNNNWITNSQLLLSPSPYYPDDISNSSCNIFSITNTGQVYTPPAADIAGDVRPVVFLKSSVTVTGGQGTQNNPYTLG